MYVLTWLGYLRQYRDLLWAGRFGDRIPVGTRYFIPVQTGSDSHPSSYTMATGSFLGVKQLERGVDYPPPSSAKVKGRVQL